MDCAKDSAKTFLFKDSSRTADYITLDTIVMVMLDKVVEVTPDIPVKVTLYTTGSTVPVDHRTDF